MRQGGGPSRSRRCWASFGHTVPATVSLHCEHPDRAVPGVVVAWFAGRDQALGC